MIGLNKNSAAPSTSCSSPLRGRGRSTYKTCAVLVPSDVNTSRKVTKIGQSSSRGFSDMISSFSRVWQRREATDEKVEDLALRTAERAKQVRLHSGIRQCREHSTTCYQRALSPFHHQRTISSKKSESGSFWIVEFIASGHVQSFMRPLTDTPRFYLHTG